MKLIILVIIGAGILLYRPFFTANTNAINASKEKQQLKDFSKTNVSFADSAFDFNSFSMGNLLLKCMN